MRIVCPSCNAEYEVPDVRLTLNKMVRCSQCEGEWVAYPKAEETEPDPEELRHEHAEQHGEQHTEPLPKITTMDRLAASVHRIPERTGLIAAWVMTGVVLIGGITATVTWRDTVVRAWPPSSRILGNVEPVRPGAPMSGMGANRTTAAGSGHQTAKAAE